jgi:hypothetical protein
LVASHDPHAERTLTSGAPIGRLSRLDPDAFDFLSWSSCP